jgi:hypothetical protein
MKFKPAPAVTLAILVAAVAAPAWPASAADEHAAHHPAASATAPTVDAGRFNTQMQTMQEMHQKMMAAKTPDERAAFMSDHMKAMQDGMAMMGQMSGGMPPGAMGMGGMKMEGVSKPMKKGEGPSEHESMHRRMDMMEMMMQMMVDRQAAMPPASK